MADAHLLGMRRSALDRAWVDWQLRRSVEAAAKRHAPALAILLGDALDEGARIHRSIRAGSSADAAKREWRGATRRFRDAWSSLRRARTAEGGGAIHLLAVVGNHDAGEGAAHTAASLQRFERSFGRSQAVETHDGVAFVRINALALAPRAPAAVRDAAWAWLAATAASTAPLPVVLLTHLPLFRPDDRACGAARALERDGVAARWFATRALRIDVTIARPSEALEEGVDVLTAAATERLLALFRPAAVLSGHTHAVCYIEHRVVGGGGGGGSVGGDQEGDPRGDQRGEASGSAVGDEDGAVAEAQRRLLVVPEFTLPAFGWRMRPDPSYAVLRVAAVGAPAATASSGASSSSAPREESSRGGAADAAGDATGVRAAVRVDVGEFSFIYRYILRELCSQFDSLPLTSLTISPDRCARRRRRVRAAAGAQRAALSSRAWGGEHRCARDRSRARRCAVEGDAAARRGRASWQEGPLEGPIASYL
jgi:hypothetical protein